MKLGDRVRVLPASNHPATTGMVGTIVEIGSYTKNQLMRDYEICLSFNSTLIYTQDQVILADPNEFEKAEQKWQKYYGI